MLSHDCSKSVWIINGSPFSSPLLSGVRWQYSCFTTRHNHTERNHNENHKLIFPTVFLSVWRLASKRLTSPFQNMFWTGRCSLNAGPVTVSGLADSQTLNQVYDGSLFSHGENRKLLRPHLHSLRSLCFPSVCGQWWKIFVLCNFILVLHYISEVYIYCYYCSNYSKT